MGSSAGGYREDAKYCPNLFRIFRLQDLSCANFREVSNRLEVILLQPFRYLGIFSVITS